MGRRALMTLVALLACSATSGAVDQSARKPKTHVVTIADMKFVPESLNVVRGDTVVWINKDVVPHTATSTGGTFDSNKIDPKASWRHTIRSAGRFTYTCAYHPTMTGLVRAR